MRTPLSLQRTASETHSLRRADAFLGSRPLSLAASLSVSLSTLRLCVSVPTLSWPLLCLSLPVRQPICLSWPPPHRAQSTGHCEGRAGPRDGLRPSCCSFPSASHSATLSSQFYLAAHCSFRPQEPREPMTLPPQPEEALRLKGSRQLGRQVAQPGEDGSAPWQLPGGP